MPNKDFSYHLISLTIALICFFAAQHNATAQNTVHGKEKDPVGQMAVVGDSSLVVIELKSASVIANIDPIKVVEDTLEYNPAAYRLAEDAMLEDILRRIPGLDINDGVVTLHGKEVKQLLIEGQRFFGGDVKVGLQNISADMIEKVRAYEKESDFSRITGIDDGEKEPVLDLRIKKNILGGWNGTASGGYGLHNRYMGRLNANKIDKNDQTSVVANVNNVNGKISINNASRSQLGGGSGGDAHKRNLGFSLSRKSTKFNMDANVHYEGHNRFTRSEAGTERAYNDGITTYTGRNATLIDQDIPKFEGRFEWTPKKNLVILLKPAFKYTSQRSLGHTIGTNYKTNGALSNNTDNYNGRHQDIFNADLRFQVTRRFNEFKKGRSLSFNINGTYNDNSDKAPLTYRTTYPSSAVKNRKVYSDTWGNTIMASGQVAYNEPFSKGFYLQTILYSQVQIKDSRKNNYDIYSIDPEWSVMDDLPDGYKSAYVAQTSSQGRYTLSNSKLTVNMRLIRKKFNITAGASVNPQFSVLEYRKLDNTDTTVHKNACYVAPNFNISYFPSKTRKLSFTYRTSVNSPSIYNLLPINNGTNPLSIHIGNESLLPAFIHKMELSYNHSNLPKQSSIVCELNGRIVQNQMSNRSIYDQATGVTTTMPFNINGNWEMNGSMAYNKTFLRSFNIVQHASVNYTDNRTYLYDSHLKTDNINALRRLMGKESFDFTYRNEWLEMTANVSGDITMETCSLRPEMNQLPYSLGAGLKATATCPWNMRITADFSFLSQRGYTINILNREYYVLNASVSQPFLKRKLVLSFEAFDVLGQLPNLVRNFSQTSRNITTYNGYNQYFIARLVYKFRIKK